MRRYINNRTECIWETLIFILFFSPLILYQYPLIGLLATTLKILIFFGLIIVIFVNRVQLSPVTISIIAIIVCVFFATLLNEPISIFDVFRRYYTILGVALLIELKQKETKSLYKPIFYASSFLIYINLLAMIFAPKGLYVGETNNAPYWIIGQKQDLASVYIVSCMTSLLIWPTCSYKMKLLIFLTISSILISFLLAFPLGLMLCLIILFGLTVYTVITNRYFRLRLFVKVYLLLESLCIVIAYTASKLVLLWLMLDRISASNDDIHTNTKSDTILSRIMMWKDGLKLIMDNPLGNGILSEQRYNTVMRNSYFHPHIHNTFLDLTMTGGIVASMIFVYINFIVANKICFGNTYQKSVFTYTIFCFLILMLTEVPYWPFIWSVYILAYYSMNQSVSDRRIIFIKK